MGTASTEPRMTGEIPSISVRPRFMNVSACLFSGETRTNFRTTFCQRPSCFCKVHILNESDPSEKNEDLLFVGNVCDLVQIVVILNPQPFVNQSGDFLANFELNISLSRPQIQVRDNIYFMRFY